MYIYISIILSQPNKINNVKFVKLFVKNIKNMSELKIKDQVVKDKVKMNISIHFTYVIREYIMLQYVTRKFVVIENTE